ncbi:WhiB family transcriptional regulator [Streptomyces sp. ISL-43]|uniref:WhiB family transcriptional regulator n=1 Tax=Streptomyces sp. ISL-43 TaxID=2819183 RepID=UPI001BE77169|nr:WhiB family transcriptional regulator [Streptomyces sp. ISL-43]MBT2449451.1 WhiB family transcriptional regulator [Streptomyces sp. ISL-43]
MTTPTDWMTDSGPRPCRTNPELWFSKSAKDKEAAVQACLACPLLIPCRDYALTTHVSHGVWGGLTETERRKFPNGLPACSTLSSYMRHRVKRETCAECEAWRATEVETARRASLADEHLKGGTRTGARIHLRLGERACPACATAAYREREAELAGRPKRRRAPRRSHPDAA